ncbi:MAG: DUF1080 domain-containing protein [Planctomycetaceae bacterium]|jgi:hypothetical protein|nr:DUF1080 domain-containing protein [Planctomycetaceae bacterium]
MKKNIVLLAALALLFPVCVLAEEPSAADGWAKIFNGKNLTGWKSNETKGGEFYVTDEGEIASKGGRAHLFYMEELKNFELKLDVYINDNGNSGVYVLSPWVDNNWPTGGFELQVNSTHSDSVKTGSLYEIIKIYESPSGPDQWFTYHIIVKDNTLTVKVNDKTLYTYVDPSSPEAAKKAAAGEKVRRYIGQTGHIALQQHDPGSKPKFKNIYLKKLP